MMSLLLAGLLGAAPLPAEARVAVLVGSNAAVQGRQALRYAGRDAQAMADVLVHAGRFAREDVQVLSEPTPAQVLSALDAARQRVAGKPALLFFYYSGHADDRALFPGGEALPLEALKAKLDDPAVPVRIGVIDSCRGGGWTRAKGLTPTEPFAPPVTLLTEGTALLAASSGFEDAHEAEALRGSYFTHHLVAGLRGAADASDDGLVTLGEAFAYANRLTIRDTALHAAVPQHPSFDLRLHGRQDITLTSVHAGATVLALEQEAGPLQIVQLGTGLVLVEATPGQRTVRVALPPGPYLVRRLGAEGIAAREISVVAGQTTTVEEASLALVGNAALAPKGPSPAARATATSPGAKEWRVSVGLGSRFDVLRSGAATASDGLLTWSLGSVFNVTYGLTDRLTVPLAPGLSYRFGQRGDHEVVLTAGASQLGLGYSSIEHFLVSTTLRLGVDDRLWLGANTSLLGGVDVHSDGRWSGLVASTFPHWSVTARLGVSHTFRDLVTVNVGASFSERLVTNWRWSSLCLGEGLATLSLGSPLRLGLRPLPLLQVHVSPSFSVDGWVSVDYDFDRARSSQAFLVGFTWMPKEGGEQRQ